jgi:uncharacterized protein
MKCPRCNVSLNTDIIHDLNRSVEIDKCPQCGGIWFDNGELEQLETIVEAVYVEIRNVPGKADQLKALSCPSCDNMQLMQKAEHPRDRKVIMDYCPVCHGIWLDKGELEAIQKENWLITIASIFKRLE